MPKHCMKDKCMMKFRLLVSKPSSFAFNDKSKNLFQGGDVQKPLSSINEDLVRTGKTLLEIDNSKVHCLKEFVNCKILVEWLREALEGMCQLEKCE